MNGNLRNKIMKASTRKSEEKSKEKVRFKHWDVSDVYNFFQLYISAASKLNCNRLPIKMIPH